MRSIKISDGRLVLNGRPLDIRGVGLQEDSRTRGFAIDNAARDQQLAWTRALGATLIRAHYPLHPYTLERADRLGMLVWSEVPVYQVDTEELAKAQVRDAAVEVMETSVLADRNHPSVLLWSVGNEMSSRPGPSQAAYIKRAAETAKRLDPTRPVGIAFAAAPGVGCQAEYAPLDVIGINDYFGWYPGPNGSIADRELLSEYLDTVRACYPDKALMISEFGAEANRDGPIEERGTHQFQQDFIRYHLGVYATKSWLSGSIYWALQEFRVRPQWDGGNPRPRRRCTRRASCRSTGSRSRASRPCRSSSAPPARSAHPAPEARPLTGPVVPVPATFDRRSWPVQTPPPSPSSPATSRARGPRAACAARVSSPASSTAAAAIRCRSPSMRAICGTRCRPPAPSSSSRWTARARRRCSRTPSTIRCAARRRTWTSCGWI